jgi:hypothetical protein
VPEFIDARLSCQAINETRLMPLEIIAPFPLKRVDDQVRYYLKATELVQADDPRIRKLAAELTRDVGSQFDAVQRVISWVVDHVRYVTPPERYDAVYSLESGKGNCQNFSHLSGALLRTLGIPVRIANGVTASQPFDVRGERDVFTFRMGQGRHSWIEVWFPDIGWMPFDPQNTQLFVSNRFVRIEVGADNRETTNDGLLSWMQDDSVRTRPKLQEVIEANFLKDAVAIHGDRQNYGPRNLLLSPGVKAEFMQMAFIPPTPPSPAVPKKEKEGFLYNKPFIFGNIAFPQDVDFAFPRIATSTDSNRFEMKRSFLVETAEYVTTKLVQYAQVAVLKKPVKLDKVGLALHKFGGDGWLWVDIFQDQDGRPGKLLTTSEMLSLEELSLKPGYRWTDFPMKKNECILMPGSYWVALGFSGSPIVSWFFTYGKPVGPVEGTRYKSVFEEAWSGAMNYEFNYRIAGFTVE